MLNLTTNKEQLDLGDTTAVMYFFSYAAAASGNPLYVNNQLLMHALKLMSPSQRRQLLRTAEEARSAIDQGLVI